MIEERYLFISEDGCLTEQTTVTEEDVQAMRDGYLTIVEFDEGHFWQLYDTESWERV